MWLEILTAVVVFLQAFFGSGDVSKQSHLIDTAHQIKAHSVVTAVVTYVVDGDTIDVLVGTTTQTTRVRYIGINTPEPYPRNRTSPECGSHEATVANTQLVAQQAVTLVTDKNAYDQFGRLLAYVYVEDVFINKELLTLGFATTLSIKPNTRYQTLFNQLQAEAQKSQVGNWSTCPHWR
jgi:micrococcal nuclease